MSSIRVMASAAALTFGLVLWWATRGVGPGPEASSRVRETPASQAAASPVNSMTPLSGGRGSAAPVPDQAAPDDSQLLADAGFSDYVEEKYRFLLASTRSPRGSGPLRAALHERERIMVAINTARQAADEPARADLPELERQLAGVDQQVRSLLPSADLAAFDALKDSHIEQFQLDEYAQGISNVAPLADADRRAILYSKLAYRARFREVLDQTGLMRAGLTPSQRQVALAQVTRALRESRDSFLQEARQHLGDEEQYTLLANYENGEYAAELEKLRNIAAGG
jgi:hypothetical protein